MYARHMAKKPKSSDVNVTAFEILKAVTGEPAPISRRGKPEKPAKNPAAVALGTPRRAQRR